MKFTHAYACSVCSPTRVSLMTGLNAARHRVTNWTLRRNASNDRRHPTLTFPKWNVNGLSPEAEVERTIHAKALPAFLREAGYRTSARRTSAPSGRREPTRSTSGST